MRSTDALSVTSGTLPDMNVWQRMSLSIGIATTVLLGVALLNIWSGHATELLLVIILGYTVAAGAYTYGAYHGVAAGIQNHGVFHRRLSSRGLWGWVLGIVLTTFYVLLYFKAELLGLGQDGGENWGAVALFDPLSQLLKGQSASQWFMYGTLYTLAILVLGMKFIIKYRHNRYQILRTVSVMFFQLGFAFLLPEIMSGLNNAPHGPVPFYDLKNMWPLNYYLFYEWNINALVDSGLIGLLMLGFGVLTIFVISPMLTYFYGKRWYCSWVCGCGGLAETAGDSFRQLSDKSLNAWRVERWLIHIVLVFAVLMTEATIYSMIGRSPHLSFMSRGGFVVFVVVLLLVVLGGILAAAGAKKWLMRREAKIALSAVVFLISAVLIIHHFSGVEQVFFFPDDQLQKWYGFMIGAVFSGVIGTGFYPILGNRVWCRFGCPMAAILGIQQKFFSRFRITTNGGQCISCGNCSTYCEMGIDVRWYAQRGQDVVRASCVGCGICSAVCPRGVLRLENGGDIHNKASELRALHIGMDGVRIID